MKDLFGVDIGDDTRPKKDGAHPAPPGSGPEGMTCKSCAHHARISYHLNYYHKCKLMKNAWTHGPGSDIRCKDAACDRWEQKQ